MEVKSGTTTRRVAMMNMELDVSVWANQQFGTCELGDVRRTRRAVKMAAQFAANPSGSTPDQTENWADCKAAYNLVDQDDVTFRAVAEPHWKQTQMRTSGHYLILGDTTVVNFGNQREIEGLGIIGSGKHQGFLLHSGLMVDAESEELIGLAGQTIYYRRRCPTGETHRERLARDRESRVWGDVIELVGPPAENVIYTHVFDRGADNFEVYCRLLLQRSQWVVRAAQRTRITIAPDGTKQRLQDYVDTLPARGTYQLEVRANNNQPARTAKIEVRGGMVMMPVPRDTSPFVRECGISMIVMNVVEAREVDAPSGVTPLRWVLLTSHAATTLEECLYVIEIYEKRPLIEEWHKALKTGCQLESRLYETAERLEVITAFLSVVAVRLVQLKTVARAEPERSARQVVPLRWIEMLQRLQKGKHRRITTVREFYRGLARLGGFLARRRDGEPGWITIWRGFEKIHLMIRGADAAMKKCG
jgi:hypothetical protein